MAKASSKSLLSHISRWVVAAVIASAALCFAALFVNNLRNAWAFAGSLPDIALYYGLPGLAAIGLLASLRLSASNRLALALCLGSVPPALYAAEGYLWYRYFTNKGQVAADFDSRSKLDVITSLRQSGVRAYPAVRARSILVEAKEGTLASPLQHAGKQFLPLANAPGRTIVACNETGQWMIFEADQFGFLNAPAAWERSSGKIALVGDSFTQGYCLPPDQNIAAHLQKAGYDIVNLGTSGFGPLSELASIKEYLGDLRPQTVVWMYFEGNDIINDLGSELRSPILRAYLDKSFSQELKALGGTLASSLETYLDTEMVAAMARVDHPHEKLLDFLQIWRLRESLGLDQIALGAINADTEQRLAIFGEVLSEAKRTVEAWGGNLVFVYLPDSARYMGARYRSPIREHLRASVLKSAQALELPIIDLHSAFSASSDPSKFFVFPGSHYNAEGYELAARIMTGALVKRAD